MKVTAGCGHKVTLQVLPDRERFWQERAHLYMCAECYQKESGKSVGSNTAMVREIKEGELV